MNSLQNRNMHHLRILSCDIGSRPIGTKANTKASDYIAEIFRNAGLEVETQEFEVPNWVNSGSILTINGESFNVRTNTFSAPCEITAEIIPFCTIEELESYPELTNKIAFLYGELTMENLVPKGFTIYNPEHHRHIISLLEQKKPSAVITVRMQKENDLPLFNDWDFNIPSVTVTPEIGLMIFKNLESASVQLIIDSKRNPGRTKNIIGRLGGRREERIILSAHYDTVFGTNGAFDNASGVSVLLTLAEQIANRTNLETGFEFVAFSSEEYLGLGDQIYVSKNNEDFQKVLVAMNFDGIGQAIGTNNITLMSGSDELRNELITLKKRHPAIQWTNPWYESNHITFFSCGVPSIPFSCNGVSNLLHTKEDQIEWISSAKLHEVYTLAVEIIDKLQSKKIEWTRI